MNNRERDTLVKIHEGLKTYFERNFLMLYNTYSDRLSIIAEEDDMILFDYTSSSGRHTYRYIRVKDVSTHKYYFLSVPYDVITCYQAIAWTFGMNISEYKVTKET